MRFLPFERLELRFDAPIEVVAQRLSECMTDPGALGFALTRALLGEFDGRHFRLRQGIGAANAWRPVIEGRLEEEGDATRLEARLRLSWPIGLVTALFFALLSAALALSLASSPRQSSALAVFIALSYAAMMAAFKFEAERSRRLLVERLGGVHDASRVEI